MIFGFGGTGGGGGETPSFPVLSVLLYFALIDPKGWIGESCDNRTDG
jgi:hypothetical protein